MYNLTQMQDIVESVPLISYIDGVQWTVYEEKEWGR